MSFDILGTSGNRDIHALDITPPTPSTPPPEIILVVGWLSVALRQQKPKLIRDGAKDGHLDFHTAELWFCW